MLAGLLRDIFSKRAVREEPPVVADTSDDTPRSAATYSADGFATVHNANFLSDPNFSEAYRLGTLTGHRLSDPLALHIE